MICFSVQGGSVAVCLATGISSEKGRLVAHILHPAAFQGFLYDIELPAVAIEKRRVLISC